MKLLVLAQIPPPLHGQSLMVRALVEGLPAQGIALHHVNLLLSESTADIGRWRFAKFWKTLVGAARAIHARFAHGCDTLYYVPAPAKRGALYRDWLIMLLCRPFFPRLVLHWHAAGLGEWLDHGATRLERVLTRVLLGRADLAIVLAESLRADAEKLRALTIAVVPNGIVGPGVAPAPITSGPSIPCRVLFLGLCSETKGLFSAAAAVLDANQRVGGIPAFVLTAAGPFDSEATAQRFRRLCGEQPGLLQHVGTVGEQEKQRLFTATHALLFPTTYPAEGMPLVALEALAHDRPIIATRWRALPEIVTAATGVLVESGNPEQLVAALLQIRERPPAAGVCRARFLERFTVERHLTTLARSLASLRAPLPKD